MELTLVYANGARKAPGLVLLVILPALLLLAACGGDDEGGGSESTATRAEETDGAEPTEEDEEASATEEDGGGNGGGADIDACSLLTDEEVEAVLGTPVTGAQDEQEVEPFVGCDWEGEGLALVGVTVLTASEEEVKAFFEFDQENSEAVNGLGDGAHWSDLVKSLEILADDNTDVTISVVSPEIDEKQAAIDLAEKVLDRLP